LSLLARQAWDRNAERIHAEGRWQTIDFELLALFCETLEFYLRCRDEINEHGILVRGRTERELVRNPALTPMNQARDHLLLLAPRIPLANRDADVSAVALDSWLKEMCADECG
jgi:P27 family predicted phage terminase small subunit